MRLPIFIGFFISLFSAPAFADGTDCVVYATDYANSYVGGDMIGDAVRGGMAGAVAGGEWDGPSGAERGAQVGGALGVLNNLGSLPGGWQALYDMAYQICLQADQTSARPAPVPGTPQNPCGSTAKYNSSTLRAPNSGAIRSGSSARNCR